MTQRKKLNKAKELRRLKRLRRKRLEKLFRDVKRHKYCKHPLPHVVVTLNGKLNIGRYLIEVCPSCGRGKRLRRLDPIL